MALNSYVARRAILAIAGAIVVVLALTHLPWGGDASATPTPAVSSIADGSGAAASPSLTLMPGPTATATATPTARVTVPPAATPHPSGWVDVWQQDPAFVAAKLTGRVVRDSKGRVTILAAPPATAAFPATASLVTGWTGLIQEPPRTGTDDRGTAYVDYHYSLFCGEGTAAVVLYYWPNSKSLVTTTAGTYKEPIAFGHNYYASTYWKATGAAGNARGAILYLATVEWPAPDRGLTWWAQSGLTTWTSKPPSVEVSRLTDGINWEASAHKTLSYFYVQTPASQLTLSDMKAHIHSDIGMGAPVIIAARTSDGTNRLPFWRTKPARKAVNHFVTVVGYDDTAGTYTVMDTCGLTCNDRTMRSGIGTMSQTALYALIGAEVDNDGIIW